MNNKLNNINNNNPQDKEIIKTVIAAAIGKLETIETTYKFKGSGEAGELEYYFKDNNQIRKNIDILKELETELLEAEDIHEVLLSYFSIKIGNIKLNDLVFNFSTGHLCYSFLNGYCKNCNICYAFKYEYSRTTLKSRLKNYIFIEYVILSENYELLKQAVKNTDLNKLVKTYNNTIKAAIRKENKKENPDTQKIGELESKIIKNIELIRNIRINENGEIENKHYTFLTILLSELETLLNKELKFKYSYTHNKELDITQFKELININKSLDFNECIEYIQTIGELKHNIYCNCTNSKEAGELEKFLKTHNVKYCSCKSDCTSCSYCKTNIKRVIITINH